MEKNIDIAALGELLIDFTEAGTGADGMRLFEQNPGGAPANLLTVASHMGYRTEFIGKVGKDMHGAFLKKTLEKEIADLVEVYLKNDGYEVLKFYNATDALHCVMEEQEPDLALLDVMLPDMSGFTLCQKIREKYLFPIIMLTAKVEDMDKITGLTLGADDYITKPFNPLELMARVKTQLRRYTRYNPGSMEPEETLPADKIDIRGL